MAQATVSSAAGGVRITGDAAIAGKLEKLAAAMSPEGCDAVVHRVALNAFTKVVQATPKKWFGQVRAAWEPPQKQAPAFYSMVNNHKVMFFLEFGTGQGSGGYIYPKATKALFIPLTRAATFGYKPGMKFGVDYILAKRVRGITPRHIAATVQKESEKELLEALTEHGKQAMKD